MGKAYIELHNKGLPCTHHRTSRKIWIQNFVNAWDDGYRDNVDFIALRTPSALMSLLEKWMNSPHTTKTSV
jgi:hypothetical protein